MSVRERVRESENLSALVLSSLGRKTLTLWDLSELTAVVGKK